MFFSSPCQRQCELLLSLGVRRPLTFHILIFSSETPQPNESRTSGCIHFYDDLSFYTLFDVIKKSVDFITYCADVIKKCVEAEVIIKMNTTWCYKYMYKLMSSHIQLNFSHKTFVWIKHVKILICLNFCSNTCLICTVLVQKKNNKYFENSSDFHVVFTLIITTQISNERN